MSGKVGRVFVVIDSSPGTHNDKAIACHRLLHFLSNHSHHNQRRYLFKQKAGKGSLEETTKKGGAKDT